MTGQNAGNRISFDAQGQEFLKSNTGETEFNYAANRPPLSEAISGRTVTLRIAEPDMKIVHAFDDKQVEWEIVIGPGQGDKGKVPYEAFEMAPDIFFLSFLARETESIGIAADFNRGIATVVKGDLKDRKIESITMSAFIEEAFNTKKSPSYHPPFSLGGTRLLNTYADNVAYEHIYLTRRYKTWLGCKGPQVGQADTEEYYAFKITDGVYYLYWNEKVLTTQMTFLFNFNQGYCVGQVFGDVEGTIVHNTIGAYTHLIHTKLAELPNVTRLDIYCGE